MLEQLFSLVQGQSQEAIVNNPAVPNEHNEGAMAAILSSVMGGLQNNASQGGNAGDLMGMLGGLVQGGQGGGSIMNNPVVGGMAQNAIGTLMSKFGIESSAAQGIVSQVLPGILGAMANKHNDTKDSFNVGDVMGVFADGKLDAGDLLGLAGKFMGGGNAGGGAAGGLGGLLGNLFGK